MTSDKDQYLLHFKRIRWYVRKRTHCLYEENFDCLCLHYVNLWLFKWHFFFIRDSSQATCQMAGNTSKYWHKPIWLQWLTDANLQTLHLFSVICSSFEVKFQHVSPLDDSYLYIGSTATVRVDVSLPVEFIENLRITLYHDGDNVDVEPKAVHPTNDVKYASYINNYGNRYGNVRFLFYVIQVQNSM